MGGQGDLVNPWALHKGLEEAVGVADADCLNHVDVSRKASTPAWHADVSVCQHSNFDDAEHLKDLLRPQHQM